MKMENVFRRKPSLEIVNLLRCSELWAMEKREFMVEIWVGQLETDGLIYKKIIWLTKFIKRFLEKSDDLIN